MANPAWGTKRVCQSCGTVYYDMKKNPPVCPSCSTKFDPEALLRSRRGRALPEESKAAHEEVVAKDELDVLKDAELDDDLLDDEEEDDALIEDASELGGEDDDDVVVSVENNDDR